MDGKETSAVLESRLEGPALEDAAHSSGICWSAVIGGAFVAAAFYLILVALGAGFGLSAISPWSGTGASASTVGTIAIIWLIFIEIVASALGGYLTGRLRTKWTLIHTDEVYFRDTANGFLSWAVALVISVTLLGSAAASMLGHRAQSASSTAQAGSISDSPTNPQSYWVDTLFRTERLGPEGKDASSKAEAAAILANALEQKEISPADRNYLAQLIAVRTGISQAQAQARLSEVVTSARQQVDAVRRVSAHFLLWLFLTLSMGAFSASYAALIGGRQRDHVRAF